MKQVHLVLHKSHQPSSAESKCDSYGERKTDSYGDIRTVYEYHLISQCIRKCHCCGLVEGVVGQVEVC